MHFNTNFTIFSSTSLGLSVFSAQLFFGINLQRNLLSDFMLFMFKVAVPIYVAKNMTYPERVTKSNLKMLQSMVNNGPNQWPGANYVEKRPTNKMGKELKFLGEVSCEMK